jgi:hypothetical protein
MKTKKQVSIKGVVLPAIALCSLLWGNAAQAALMTYAFEGAVSEVTGVLFPTLNTGLNMTGNVTFDTGTAAVAPGVGIYLNPITALNVNIGSYNASKASGANGIFLTNSAPGSGIDNITTFASMSSATAINGTLPTMFDVSLTDPSGNVLSDVNLHPTAPPSLNSFASNQWRLTFANGNVVLGSLTKLTAVPLPAAILLFGAGLISLVGLGAGGLRNLRGTQA